jgi:hypothetical protein
MNIEDTWGGDIVTAAIAALAHSTPPDFLFCRYRTWNIAGNLESCFSYCFCATSLCFSIVGWVYSCALPILASDCKVVGDAVPRMFANVDPSSLTVSCSLPLTVTLCVLQHGLQLLRVREPRRDHRPAQTGPHGCPHSARPGGDTPPRGVGQACVPVPTAAGRLLRRLLSVTLLSRHVGFRNLKQPLIWKFEARLVCLVYVFERRPAELIAAGGLHHAPARLLQCVPIFLVVTCPSTSTGIHT